MGQHSRVGYDVNGARATITINRPEAGNRIDGAVSRDMIALMSEAEANLDVKAIVVTGAGDVFSLGGQPDGFPGRDISAQLDYAEAFIQLICRMRSLRTPIISRVNGDALAGGASLVLASDLAVACDDSKFGYPEIDEGSFPMLAMGVSSSALPAKLSLDLFFTGRLMTAMEAQEAWLVNQIVPREGLDAAVDEWVDKISEKRRTTIGIGRVGYHAMAGMSPEARLRYAQFMMTTVFSDLENQPHKKDV